MGEPRVRGFAPTRRPKGCILQYLGRLGPQGHTWGPRAAYIWGPKNACSISAGTPPPPPPTGPPRVRGRDLAFYNARSGLSGAPKAHLEALDRLHLAPEKHVSYKLRGFLNPLASHGAAEEPPRDRRGTEGPLPRPPKICVLYCLGRLGIQGPASGGDRAQTAALQAPGSLAAANQQTQRPPNAHDTNHRASSRGLQNARSD